MGNVLVDDAYLYGVANALREKHGTEKKYLPSEMENAVRGIQSCGGDVADSLRYVKRVEITSLNIFGKADVVLNLDNATTLQNFCYFALNYKVENLINNQVESLTINCPNVIKMMASMLSCDNYNLDNVLKTLTLNFDTSQVTNFSKSFMNLQALQIINGNPLNFSSATDVGNTFGACKSLKEVRLVSGSLSRSISFIQSPLLSDASIQSIIDGLADLTGQTAQTITFHADVKAKLTTEQIATITSKNWTLA